MGRLGCNEVLAMEEGDVVTVMISVLVVSGLFSASGATFKVSLDETVGPGIDFLGCTPLPSCTVELSVS